jgi:hypothetical protein
VPSQVVPFIETKFRWIESTQPPAPFIADRGAMCGLVRLIEKIPEELLVSPPPITPN